MRHGRGHLFVAGGRYGLGSKDFTPRMVLAVLTNMLRKNVKHIKRPFTVGIHDDVTNLSLVLGRQVNVFDESVTQCKLDLGDCAPAGAPPPPTPGSAISAFIFIAIFQVYFGDLEVMEQLEETRRPSKSLVTIMRRCLYKDTLSTTPRRAAAGL